ncbi:MAG: hypothetical protein Q3998_02260 [Porphyromonas sp.]|nr:hypothetical protein [Porphyromonas sp.]
MNATIKSVAAKGDFVLEIGNKEVLHVFYKSIFSNIANLNLNGENIEIRPRNVWCKKIDILKDGVNKGEIRFNWKGYIILRLATEESYETYVIKSKGLFRSDFEVRDSRNNPLFLMKPKVKWKKANFEYDILFNNDAEAKNPLIELLVYATYGVNLQLSTFFALVIAG